MTVCKQLNYLYRKSGNYGDYSEELLADGEVYGRNWSLIERTWKRDISYRGGKYHYIIRIDISEYEEGYRKVIYKSGFRIDDFYASLTMIPKGYNMLRFTVHNRSPGLWENGFNPNYWLEAEMGSYMSDEERLRKVVETGIDMRDVSDIGLIVRDVLDQLKPTLDMLRDAAPVGIPYKHWWGDETPPPPRKPIY